MELESSWAWAVARDELAAPLPRRWAHVRGVARSALDLAERLPVDVELLATAALLHDVGYAPRLAEAGFHPLDGARFLRDERGASAALTSLVANHTHAVLEADERGLRAQLESEFPVLDPWHLDALTYCDLTTAPDGRPIAVRDRFADIEARYQPDTPVGRFIRRARPEILATVGRVADSARYRSG